MSHHLIDLRRMKPHSLKVQENPASSLWLLPVSWRSYFLCTDFQCLFKFCFRVKLFWQSGHTNVCLASSMFNQCTCAGIPLSMLKLVDRMHWRGWGGGITPPTELVSPLPLWVITIEMLHCFKIMHCLAQQCRISLLALVYKPCRFIIKLNILQAPNKRSIKAVSK